MDRRYFRTGRSYLIILTAATESPRIRSETGGKLVCRRDRLLQPLVVRRGAPNTQRMVIRGDCRGREAFSTTSGFTGSHGYYPIWKAVTVTWRSFAYYYKRSNLMVPHTAIPDKKYYCLSVPTLQRGNARHTVFYAVEWEIADCPGIAAFFQNQGLLKKLPHTYLISESRKLACLCG